MSSSQVQGYIDQQLKAQVQEEPFLEQQPQGPCRTPTADISLLMIYYMMSWTWGQNQYMFDYLKEAGEMLKSKITKDKIEELLYEATSSQNWQASSNVLNQLANATYNYQEMNKIVHFIEEKRLKGSKNWRKINKTMNLIEYMLKNGNMAIVNAFKLMSFEISKFEHYTSYEDGEDRGGGVREKATIIINMLGNQEKLEEQRQASKKLRERLGQSIPNSSSSYGGYGGSGYGGSSSYGGSSYENSYGQPYEKSNTGGNYSSKSPYGGVGSGSFAQYPTPLHKKMGGLDEYRKKEQIDYNAAHEKIEKAKRQMERNMKKIKPNTKPQDKTYGTSLPQPKPTPQPPSQPIPSPKPPVHKPQVDLLGDFMGPTSTPISTPTPPPVAVHTPPISTPTYTPPPPSTYTPSPPPNPKQQVPFAPAKSVSDDLSLLLGSTPMPPAPPVSKPAASGFGEFTSYQSSKPTAPPASPAPYVFQTSTSPNTAKTTIASGKSDFESSLFDFSDIKEDMKKGKADKGLEMGYEGTGMNTMMWNR